MMKIVPLLAAAAVAVAAMPLAAAPASAAKAGVAAADQVRISIGNRHHRRAHWRTVCSTQWRYHHRVRVCRKVRVWR